MIKYFNNELPIFFSIYHIMFFVLTDYLVFILINELKDSNMIIGFNVLNPNLQPTT